jgi:maltose-binding protein MalE
MKDVLEQLVYQGCFPSIYRRGKVWRAHVNAAGNFWSEDKDPERALSMAVQLWEQRGKPMDGMADIRARNTGEGA